MDKLLEYRRSWIQHVNRMPRNRLPRIMKYYSPTGRRNPEETSGFVRPERINEWPNSTKDIWWRRRWWWWLWWWCTPCGNPLFNRFLKSWIRPNVCVIQQRYHFLGLHSFDDKRRWAMSFAGMKATREIRSTRRKTSPNSTFPTTSPTWTKLELNSSHFGEWPAPRRLNHGMTGFQIIHSASYSGPKRTKTDGQ